MLLFGVKNLGKKCIAKKGGYKGGRGGGLEVLPPKAVNLDGFFLAGLLT